MAACEIYALAAGMTQPEAIPESGFRHEAFFYSDADEFLAGTVPFIQQGLEADEAILVATPRAQLDPLSDALNGEGERIQFADMEELGRNPARIIPAWRDFLAEHMAGGRGLRGVGEPIWAGRSAAEVDECQRHESLLNLAFADERSFSLMCPYDSARLDDQVLAAAEHSHPVLFGPDRVSASATYAGPTATPFAGRLEPAPTEAPSMAFNDVQTLAGVRRYAAARAQAIGLNFQRIDDFVLVANELATNSLQHGHGKTEIRFWRDDDAVTCEVENEGRIDEPLAGRRRPSPDQLRGRGLWLVNQLSDLVQIRSGEWGSLVRAQMLLRSQPRPPC
jgi:anti-sigma regulatory factor (Ser/Thr protein kinase)